MEQMESFVFKTKICWKMKDLKNKTVRKWNILKMKLLKNVIFEKLERWKMEQNEK